MQVSVLFLCRYGVLACASANAARGLASGNQAREKSMLKEVNRIK